MAAGSTTFEVFRSGKRLCRASASADSGYQYDSAALMQQEAVSVRGTGISHLRLHPSCRAHRSETAPRVTWPPAASDDPARVRPPGFDGYGVRI
jgi:hypothetical protein